ncbi:MAG: LamG domain-containing protein [Candidatus Microsaccharimonas sp.]
MRFNRLGFWYTWPKSGFGFTGGTWLTTPSVSGLLGTWVHVAITWNGSDYTLYLNGTSVATAVETDTLPSLTSLWLGGWEWGNYRESLDEFRLYDEALDAAQVATLMNTAVGDENSGGYPIKLGDGTNATAWVVINGELVAPTSITVKAPN